MGVRAKACAEAHKHSRTGFYLFLSSLRAALAVLGREEEFGSYAEHLQEMARKYEQSLATE